MTVEVLPDGGVRFRATPEELHTLSDNAETALDHGRSHAPFLTRDGVAEFVIAESAS